MSRGMAVISLLVGAVFIFLGGSATLSNFGIEFAKFPAFFYSMIVTKYALLLGGILLLVDSASIRSFNTMMPSVANILLGILLAILGAFPLLMEYNLLGWLPFAVKFTIPAIVLSALLTFFGAYLIVSAVRLYRTSAMFGR